MRVQAMKAHQGSGPWTMDDEQCYGDKEEDEVEEDEEEEANDEPPTKTQDRAS